MTPSPKAKNEIKDILLEKEHYFPVEINVKDIVRRENELYQQGVKDALRIAVKEISSLQKENKELKAKIEKKNNLKNEYAKMMTLKSFSAKKYTHAVVFIDDVLKIMDELVFDENFIAEQAKRQTAQSEIVWIRKALKCFGEEQKLWWIYFDLQSRLKRLKSKYKLNEVDKE